MFGQKKKEERRVVFVDYARGLMPYIKTREEQLMDAVWDAMPADVERMLREGYSVNEIRQKYGLSIIVGFDLSTKSDLYYNNQPKKTEEV